MQEGSGTTPEERKTAPAPEQNRPGSGEESKPAAAASGEAEDPLVRLEREKAELALERDQAKEQALRALAEAENTRRRVERERSEAVKYAAIPLLRDLVKVADNLSRALAAVPEGALDEKTKAFRDGVALTERELLSLLERQKVEKIDPLGQKMDPNFHEAMFEVPDPAKEPGTVVQVLEVGWKLHDRLIRPARVAVAKAP